MFSKNNILYADAGKYLINGLTVGSTMPLDLKDGAMELDIDLSDLEIRGFNDYKVAVCTSDLVSFPVASGGTYDDVRDGIIEMRYEDNERTLIMLNKDNSDEDAQSYQQLVNWISFSETVATAICKKLNISIDETIDTAKIKLLRAINKYDSSDEVNCFSFNGNDMWLDKATRVGLMNSTTIAKSLGQETTTLWLGDNGIVLNCDDVIKILSEIEVYALECYNVTAKHKADVRGLTTLEAIQSYDYMSGYPTKLTFNL
jgi:hypothetical protein